MASTVYKSEPNASKQDSSGIIFRDDQAPSFSDSKEDTAKELQEADDYSSLLHLQKLSSPTTPWTDHNNVPIDPKELLNFWTDRLLCGPRPVLLLKSPHTPATTRRQLNRNGTTNVQIPFLCKRFPMPVQTTTALIARPPLHPHSLPLCSRD